MSDIAPPQGLPGQCAWTLVGIAPWPQPTARSRDPITPTKVPTEVCTRSPAPALGLALTLLSEGAPVVGYPGAYIGDL